jgi:putative tricarboxylic transport membrane protein
MNPVTLDKAFSTLVFFLGAYIAATAPSYGYMRGAAPGPGFFPLWTGLMIAGLSLVNFTRSLSGKEILGETIDMASVGKSAGICVTLLVYILTIDFFGMALGSGLLIFITGWIIHPKWNALFAAKLTAVAILFPIISHFLFGVYLNVPLPQGSLGI